MNRVIQGRIMVGRDDSYRRAAYRKCLQSLIDMEKGGFPGPPLIHQLDIDHDASAITWVRACVCVCFCIRLFFTIALQVFSCGTDYRPAF